ncbi:hypothetical protein FHR90_002221 [Endobacter medicaginis]|uniref:DUF2332 domain-containing protein n=3 Tax=Endobacter medicaginis TaxID=1181271 RepID=A0A839V1N9_9PROT|nr:DUF2332 family protein [Endobacter medicaginis]MBB3174380.1 hypothetical protein [Endobacter medicaginis]MCX5475335.1 DUF2332 family protein [Endobacter medicaginis]
MIDDGGVFAWQAEYARSGGTHFTAAVMEAIPASLARAPVTAAAIHGWPGDRRADALSLRVGGALHALARAEPRSGLGRLYARLDGDVAGVIADALERHDTVIASWLASPPQTNETGRAAALRAALAVVAARFDGPIELLEIGASAGLSLNMGRFGYALGELRAGPADAAVRLAPRWTGATPPGAGVEIASSEGIDVAPLRIGEATDRDRLRAFVWPDEPARRARLEAAIDLALAYPPNLSQARAGAWLPGRLERPQQAGVTRVVWHSVVLQYLPDEERAAVVAAIEQAGGRADGQHPFAWVSFEWEMARRCMVLRLKLWPQGEACELATCHPHGAWIDWTGDLSGPA